MGKYRHFIYTLTRGSFFSNSLVHAPVTCGQTCLIRSGFPCGRCSKDLRKKKKLNLMLCQTLPALQAMQSSRQTQNRCCCVFFYFFVFVFLCVQDPPFGVSLQNILLPNRIWVFLNHLSKHKEKPATDMQTVWNETSNCVFSSRFSLGCSVDYQ